jgi:hypothetical protein
MKLKWKMVGHAHCVMSLECSCGAIFDKSMYKFDRGNDKDRISIMAEARLDEKKFPIELKFCPQCATKVVFEEQIYIPKPEYDRLKEAANVTD